MFPMTHQVDGFTGVARYPIVGWEEASVPYSTEESWTNLSMEMATSELGNLASVIDTGQNMNGRIAMMGKERAATDTAEFAAQ